MVLKTSFDDEVEKKLSKKDKNIIEFLFKKKSNRQNITDSLTTERGQINSIRFPIYFQSSDFKALNLKDYYRLFNLNDSELKIEVEEIINNELSSELDNRMLEDKNFSTKEHLHKYVSLAIHSIEIRKYYSMDLLKHLYKIIKDENFKSETLKKCFETLCKNIYTYNFNVASLVSETHRLLEKNNTLKNEILSPVKNFIENKALKSFLLSNIEPEFDKYNRTRYLKGNKTSLNFSITKSHIEKLYDMNKLEDLLNNNISDPYIKEFKEFFDKLKEKNFNAVTFEGFNKIPIEERIEKYTKLY